MRKSAEEIKREIAYKAEELFSKTGYAATSMEDICEVTERSKGSIYYHFKSKEELFLFVVKQHTYDWLEKWADKEKQYQTSTEKLYGLAEYYGEDVQNPISSTIEEFLTSQVVRKDIMDEMIALTRETYGIFKKLVEEGMASGEFRQDDVNDLMYVVNGLLAGLGPLYYEMSVEEMKRIYKKAIDVLLQGMAAGS